jgi:hypothetical protein
VKAPATANDHVIGMASKGFALGRDAATPSRGFAVATMCAGVLLLAINDALAKWLVERYTHEIGSKLFSSSDLLAPQGQWSVM